MFGMSVKSVPGCLVAIAPRLIGVPVALTPGFGPHADVLVEATLEPPPELAAATALAADDEDELVALPQAASAPAADSEQKTAAHQWRHDRDRRGSPRR